jgi:5'-3' exonuclease
MGIKGIRDLLKKQIENFEEKQPISMFTGKKIVIDASFFICMYKAVQKNTFEEAFMNLFVVLLENKIEPVFVFDGKAPEEKKLEKQKRAIKKEMQYNRVEKLELDLLKYKKNKEISQDLWNINNKKVLASKLLPNEKFFSFNKVETYVKKLRSQILEVDEKDFVILHELLFLFGIPFITAKGEAEILCSKLVRNNYADAVLTKDTDVLACCSHTMLSDINLPEQMFTVIKLEKILDCLKINEDSWIDLCIMCGTDFNENIPNIGPVRSLSYIQKYKTLETISEHINTDKLSYDKTRNLFQCHDEQIEPLPPCDKINFDEIAERITKKKLKISASLIRRRLNLEKLT